MSALISHLYHTQPKGQRLSRKKKRQKFIQGLLKIKPIDNLSLPAKGVMVF